MEVDREDVNRILHDLAAYKHDYDVMKEFVVNKGLYDEFSKFYIWVTNGRKSS